MKRLDEIIYDAIISDLALMSTVGSRVVSTSFEVPPGDDDNTPLPNIIIFDDDSENMEPNKDCVWESGEDMVSASISVAATSPAEVQSIVRKIRRAVENHIASLYYAGQQFPQLRRLTFTPLQWDFMKPCYYKEITYQCLTPADIEADPDPEPDTTTTDSEIEDSTTTE